MSISPVSSNRPVEQQGGAQPNLPAPYNKYLNEVMAAAKEFNLPPEILFAVMERESRGGAALSADGTGDGGHGRGLMQIDDRSHSAWINQTGGGLDPKENIRKGAEILRSSIDHNGGDMHAGLAGYNAGPERARKAAANGNPDSVTTGKDYGADVLAKAEKFKAALGGQAGAVEGAGEAKSFAPSAASKPMDSDPGEVANHSLLKEGSSGAEVKELQEKLNAAGFQVEANGQFNAATTEAVRAYQSKNGLMVDGIVGQQTWGSFLGKNLPPGANMLKAPGFATNDAFEGSRPAGRPAGPNLDGGAPVAAGSPPGDLSGDAQAKMKKLIEVADSNNTGRSGGKCYAFVSDYLDKAGYNINWGEMGDQSYARNFADYMNKGDNAAKNGLKKLDISNPYDAPPGAIVVVAPGSPGTAHPTAGDITVAAGGGRFINDGPNMGYGDPGSFEAKGGKVLGIYVPA